jgi:uncharacterized repeat protein (TIGR03803 family)
MAGVNLDPAGNLYGTTYQGGTSNQGVVFKVDTTGNETVLHSFSGVAVLRQGSASPEELLHHCFAPDDLWYPWFRPHLFGPSKFQSGWCRRCGDYRNER